MANETTIELKYKKLLSDEELTVKDLPKELRSKINLGLAGMLGKYAKNPNEKTLAVITKMDVEICDLIQNHLEEELETEADAKKKEEAKAEADRIAAEKAEADKKEKEEADRIAAEKAQTPEAKQAADKAAQDKAWNIEAELIALFKSGKTSVNLSDIKASAPTCYSVIFEGYKEGEENGVETTRYKLVEKEKELFELSEN